MDDRKARRKARRIEKMRAFNATYGATTETLKSLLSPVYNARRAAMVYDVEGVVVSRKPLFKEV